MNMKKLYDAAKAAGIQPFETRESMGSEISISTFNDTVENFTVAENGSLKVRGLVDGKCGTFTSDRVDDEVIEMAVNAVKESAKFGQPVDPDFFIAGGKYKYEKLNTYREELNKTPADKLIEIIKSVSKKTLAADKRINVVQGQLEYKFNSVSAGNSNGLDISHRSNYVMILVSIKAVQGDEVESGFHYEIISDLDKFDEDAFVKRAVEKTVNRLGGESVKSGKYKVVYSPESVAALLGSLGEGFSAFAVEQHVSLIEGKIGTQLFSPLLTVEQTPIGDCVFCEPFDAEGVPCKNRVLIDKGVPTGYVYDLATAKRAGVESTGNGRLEGGNIRPAVQFVTVHPGTLSQEELFKKVGDGIYIDDLGGIHSGLNPQSGDYSLQAGGYLIKNGKLDRPISLITVAGNIIKDFADIDAVGSDETLTYYGIKTPSVVIKELSVSGK